MGPMFLWPHRLLLRKTPNRLPLPDTRGDQACFLRLLQLSFLSDQGRGLRNKYCSRLYR